MSDNSDKDIAIKGGFWTSISTIVTLGTQMLRLIILTRFLEKSDFGIASITNMVIGLCLTFTDLGFASVIMYKQELSKKEFSSLYWMQLLLFVLIYFILLFIAPSIAVFYKEPLLSSLIPIAALSVIGQGIGKLYDSVLLKKYYFKNLAFRNITTNILSLLLAWWLAASGYGVYSLILSTLSQVFLLNIWNLFTGIRIQRLSVYFNFRSVIPLVKIGLYQTGTSLLDFLSNKLDVMIIGRLLGTEILGVYDLAKELVVKFVSLIKTIVSKVALPIISNNNNSDKAVVDRFLIVTKVVAYICIPICVTVAVFSELIVKILYGDKFVEAIPMVSIFAISTMFSSIAGFFDMLGIAKGRTDLNFKQTVYRILITIPVIIVACHISLMCVVWSQFIITFIILTIFWHVVVMNTYPMSFRLYCSQFGKYMIVFSLVGLVVGLIMRINIVNYLNINEFVLQIAFVVIYCLLLLVSIRLFLWDEIRNAKNLINLKKVRNE